MINNKNASFPLLGSLHFLILKQCFLAFFDVKTMFFLISFDVKTMI